MNWIELSAFCHFQGQRFALSWAKKNLSKDSYRETKSLEEALPELDVLYMTRVQRERFDDT